MKTIVALLCLAVVAHAGVIVPVAPFLPANYLIRDNLGQHSFGYSGGPSSGYETKTLDGITQGAYSYIDANNVVQSASYVADPVNGFRVAATNIPRGPDAVVPAVVASHPPTVALLDATVPQESADVVVAKAAHFQAQALARAGLH